MFNSVSKLFAALNTLSENVLGLAATVAEMNANLRGRLLLDSPEQPPLLDHQPAEANGSTGGPDYFDQLDTERLTRALVRRLERLGHQVTLQPQQPTA
jgi:hypothetical protein